MKKIEEKQRTESSHKKQTPYLCIVLDPSENSHQEIAVLAGGYREAARIALGIRKVSAGSESEDDNFVPVASPCPESLEDCEMGFIVIAAYSLQDMQGFVKELKSRTQGNIGLWGY